MATKVPDGQGYVVAYSELVRTRLKALATRARQRGMAREFRNAVMAIDSKLHQQPVEFGDPNYQLTGVNLTVYSRVVSPLVVTYAVHQHRPVVFVRSIKPFPADAF